MFHVNICAGEQNHGAQKHRDQALRGTRLILRRPYPDGSAIPARLSAYCRSFGRIAAAKGLIVPQSFQLIEIAQAAETAAPPFTIAYVSDTHLYTRNVNDRFVRSAVKAVEDVNALDPQPDFVLFGGDLAQLGRRRNSISARKF